MGGDRDDRLTIRCGEQVRQHEQRAIGCARKLLDHAFHLIRVANLRSKRLYRQQRSSSLDCPPVQERRRVWVKEICDARDVWSDTFYQFKPLTGHRWLEIREAGEIATWSRQALRHTRCDWVADLYKYRRRRAGGFPDRGSDGRRIGQDHIRPQVDQLFGELARMCYVAATPAIDELGIAAL